MKTNNLTKLIKSLLVAAALASTVIAYESKNNNNQNESFYQIKVRTAQNSLGKDRTGKELEIIPGMVAEVDVLTGKKTVLTYLLKPINRARMRAFRER